MRDDALPEVPGYRFEAKLAEGGMGVVYRAVDDTLGRTVAIKMIRGALLGKGDEEEESVARFLREARAAAQIRSNHVAHVLQFGRTEAGDLFLVLEYLDGTTLADVLRTEKRISLERAVHITRQICRGMEAAHQLGIVHRDLKPSNVMLVDQDGDREFVKILDFGVAKVVGERESGVTRAGMLVGTYTCMAPEQVVNETIDARTDVYALAVMLFRMVTGKPLFDGTDVAAVLYHHVHTPAPTPSRIAPDAGIPKALDAIVLRCLEKQPSRRIRSMADLERALAVSLAVDAAADEINEPLQTTTGLAEDETRLSDARQAVTAERDDDDVFAESGPRRSTVDPHAATQITASGSLPAPLADPPTPGTTTSSREPVSLGARTGDPQASLVTDPPPRSGAKPLVAAAAVAALVLVTLAGVALSLSGKEADVVVVVQPAGVTSPAPPPEGAPATADGEPTNGAAPEASADDAEAAASAAADDEAGSARDAGTAASAVEHGEHEDEASEPRAKTDPASARSQPRSSPKERTSETRKRRPSRKKSGEDKDEDKSAPKPPDVIPDDQKPRPRFIRVHTGKSDG